jgi:hypothetical protein
MFNTQILAGSSGQGGITQQSLKFNDDESQYLSWTPAAAGNRKTWTWSGWVKRGNIDINQYLFQARIDDSSTEGNKVTFYFLSDNTIRVLNQTTVWKQTSAVFRDTSAWYHIVLSVDTTNATTNNRIRIYINGEEASYSTNTGPSLNADLAVNSTNNHYIGQEHGGASYLDGYLADVNFIDGQALDPTSFGQFTNNYWEKKDYAGTYGTNGFHLTFQDDVVSEGFNVATWRGNGATQSISGIGFSPDLVWIKGRSSANQDHLLVDSVRGISRRLLSNTTAAEVFQSGFQITAFNSDGFTVVDDTNGGYNVNGAVGGTFSGAAAYVGWCWDAGSGSAASNTDGSITSTVKANPSYGFSIGTFTKGSGTETFGHGLTSAPELLILKRRDSTGSWFSYSSVTGATKWIRLNGTDAATTDSTYWSNTAPTSSVATISTAYNSSEQLVFYAWHSVANYSSIGSYSGTGASGNSITGLGFRPAFLMVKVASGSTGNWIIWDNTRDTNDADLDNPLFPNLSNAEWAGGTPYQIQFDADGFTINESSTQVNGSSCTYIYMAFADTREAAFWRDVSGNNNNWTPNNLDYRDSLPDSPTNNFAVFNALVTTHNLSEGNLRVDCDDSTYAIPSTLLAPSGKWYGEILINDLAGSDTYVRIGVVTADGIGKDLGGVTGTFAFLGDGRTYSQGSVATYGTAVSTGDVFQVALDNDNGKLWFGLNGTWMASGDPASGSNPSLTFTAGEQMGFAVSSGSGGFSPDFTANFGQDSTFSGATTAGGNTDDNGIGDFAYPVPAGFLSLCSASLPTPSIVDGSTAFSTVLYSGTGATQSITGVGFGSAPDFVWIKTRNTASQHVLTDSVRGVSKQLFSSLTNAETTEAGKGVTSFDSDGFTLGAELSVTGSTNNGTYTYAAWNWKAGGTAVSNTDGSITSQVSANVGAGFSIATFTGVATGVDSSFGHGLGTTPSMVIVKRRNSSDFWWVWHTDLSHPADRYLKLNDTSAEITGSGTWGGGITSSVVGLRGSSFSTGTSDTFVAYSFANTEGYSKAGSYTGNGSTDGPFVYTGFRPAWVMFKRSDSADSWFIADNKRNVVNPLSNYLFANLSNAENTSSDRADFLSNGFKVLTANGNQNASGGTYIYLAFAETPLKFANAR